MTTSSSPATRLVFIDWLRILAFGLLVLYHVGMYYVSWDWHIKSEHLVAGLEPLMRLASPWRMDLLFLVSGAATSFMLLRAGADSRLLRERALRLLPPLVFGMLVIVPPQSYLEVVHKYAFEGGPLGFMRLYLGGYGGFCGERGHCLVLPTWNHLWYLPYLFAYTLVLWGLTRVWPHGIERSAHRLPNLLRGARLLAWPILFLALTRIALRDRFPATHALVDDWFMHTQYFAMFVLGAVLARAPAMWERLMHLRVVALALALVAWAVLVSVPAGPGSPWIGLVRALVYSIVQWCGIAAALGFGRRYLNRDGAARRYLTEAVFPVYILHQTLIIVLAEALRPWHLAPFVEGPLLVAATFALSFAGFELVRRAGWARPLFGLKRAARSSGRVAAACSA